VADRTWSGLGALPLILDAHSEYALEGFGCFDDVLGNLAPNDPVLRRVPHLELPSCNFCSDDDFKISERDEVTDFELALAYNG